MATYHLSVKNISRRDGRSVVAAAAYRAGEALTNVAEGGVSDFSRKGGVVHTEILAPEGAPDFVRDRESLWNAVESAERRKDARLAKEIEISLPHELTDAQRLDLCRQFASQLVEKGIVVDMAIHSPPKGGDARNHHVHFLLTMRPVKEDGFGLKNRDLDKREFVHEQREAWAAVANGCLERDGLTERLDHRTLGEQGIYYRRPTKPVGARLTNMARQGRISLERIAELRGLELEQVRVAGRMREVEELAREGREGDDGRSR